MGDKSVWRLCVLDVEMGEAQALDDGLHALTEHLARDEAPSVAADARIAFTSDRDGYAGLYVRSGDESVERLAPGLWASHPAWYRTARPSPLRATARRPSSICERRNEGRY